MPKSVKSMGLRSPIQELWCRCGCITKVWPAKLKDHAQGESVVAAATTALLGTDLVCEESIWDQCKRTSQPGTRGKAQAHTYTKQGRSPFGSKDEQSKTREGIHALLPFDKSRKFFWSQRGSNLSRKSRREGRL